MLVIKVYATREVPIREGESADVGVTSRVELELIEEIQVQNKGKRDDEMWDYEIIRPEGIPGRVIHKREDDYRPLLRKVLGILIGYKEGGI